jgi:hypothetical protein
MDIPPKVVIDYLNLSVVFLLLKSKYPNSTRIFFLFKRKNSYIEGLLILFLKRAGFIVEYKKFSSVKSYRKHTELADSVTQNVLKKIKKDNIDNFFLRRIGNYIIWDVYRAASIIAFTHSDNKLKDSVNLFISQKRFKGDLIFCSDNKKVRFYSGSASIKDKDCQISIQSNSISFFSSFREIAAAIIKLIMIVPKKWPKNIKLDGILILHPNIDDRKYLSNQVLVDQLSNFGILQQGLKLNFNSNNYHIKRLSFTQLLSFFCHIYKGINIFFKIPKLLFKEKVFLIRDWAHVFFIQQMIKSINCSYVYSSFETYESLLFQYASNLTNECVSLSATYSFGHFPQKHEFCHQAKNVDVYFLWGWTHIDLIKASGDLSKNYVISGYVGGIFYKEFIESANKKFNYEDFPIITYYDTSIGADLFYDSAEAIKVVNELVKISMSINAKLVIKTKKVLTIYNELILKYPNNIIISSGRANLSASFNADIVVGYLFSSPAVLSGTLNKNILLYDPNFMIWEEIYKNFSEVIVNSVDDLKTKIMLKLNEQESKTFKNRNFFEGVDKYSDDRAQLRMADYINFVIENKKMGKERSIEIANDKYSFKYGKESISSNRFKDD